MIKIRVLFGAQNVPDLVNNSYTTVVADETEAQRNTHRETRKKENKALFYIHQCVDTSVFEKIVDSTMAKVMWDTLVRCYGDDASMKKAKL